MTESSEDLQYIVDQFERTLNKTALKLILVRKKYFYSKKGPRKSCEKVRVSGEEMEDVNKFKYLEVSVIEDGSIEEAVNQRLNKGRKACVTKGKLWKENMISRELKKDLLEKVVIPTGVHGSEAWLLNTQKRRKIEMFEMMCLRSIWGIRTCGRVRNYLIRERCGGEICVIEKM